MLDEDYSPVYRSQDSIVYNLTTSHMWRVVSSHYDGEIGKMSVVVENPFVEGDFDRMFFNPNAVFEVEEGHTKIAGHLQRGDLISIKRFDEPLYLFRLE